MSWVQVEILGVGEQTDRFAKALEGIPGGLQKAQWDAMKRSGQKARTQAGRLASARYQISAGQFKDHVSMKVKGEGTAMLSITFAGSVIPLRQFKIRSSANGVYAKAKQGGGNIHRAFLDEMMGGVFERKGKYRLPIEQKYGPAAPQMMNDDDVKSEMDELITTTYEERMEHEVDRILNGW
jgi:hypothetical protein